MAQEKDHDVPSENVMGSPANDETCHKALWDGLNDGARQHVDS